MNENVRVSFDQQNEAETVATVADSILAPLTSAILNGEYPPGSKLSEPILARRFGISRAPLREALRRLEERKVVTRLPRLGARVVILTPERVQEIYVAREAIEGMIAREVASTISEADITSLYSIIEAQGDLVSKSAQASVENSFDMDFHFALAHICQNEFLKKHVIEDYSVLVGMCRRQLRSASPRRIERSILEHRRIVDAIADRDAEMAEMMMRRHISASRASLENAIKG